MEAGCRWNFSWDDFYFNGFGYENSMNAQPRFSPHARLVMLYPQHYERVESADGREAFYQARRDLVRGTADEDYERDFYVKASEVDALRAHVGNSTTK